jgi:hypothetical protein
MATVVEWLLNYALGLRYQKNAHSYNTTANVVIQQVRVSQLAGDGALTRQQWSQPEFVGAVRELASQMGLSHIVQPEEDGRALLLACVRQALRVLQRPFSETESSSSSSFPLQSEAFPLGFDTGNAVLNDAGKVLRLLYAEDLRVLQTRINELMVLAQNITNNPKVDVALGKVGH